MEYAKQTNSCLVVLFFVLAVCGGCNRRPVADYSQLGLVEVQGTIMLDSKPLQGAEILLIDEQQRYSFGLTDAAGHYSMMFNSEKSGATVGKKRVEIMTTRNRLGEPGSHLRAGSLNEGDPDDPQQATIREPVPECYNTQSKLFVHITEPDSGLDFDLLGDCTTESAR